MGEYPRKERGWIVCCERADRVETFVLITAPEQSTNYALCAEHLSPVLAALPTLLSGLD
jgi:hypothetical protein